MSQRQEARPPGDTGGTGHAKIERTNRTPHRWDQQGPPNPFARELLADPDYVFRRMVGPHRLDRMRNPDDYRPLVGRDLKPLHDEITALAAELQELRNAMSDEAPDDPSTVPEPDTSARSRVQVPPNVRRNIRRRKRR